MAKDPKPALKPFEPEWLERSLDRYYTVGLLFMLVLIVAFPLYKLTEPNLRKDAKAEQQANYIVTGQALFKNTCAQCHGEGGVGGGSGPTLNSKEFLGAISDGQMQSIIGVGVPGSDMSAWNMDFGGALTSEQIRELVTYLRSLEPNAPSIPDWRKGATAGG